MEEVAGGCRRLHNVEPHNLFALTHIIRVTKSRRMKWVAHVARIRKARNMYKILIGKSEGKRPLGRPGRTWKDNIRVDHGEIVRLCTGYIWFRIGTNDFFM